MARVNARPTTLADVSQQYLDAIGTRIPHHSVVMLHVNLKNARHLKTPEIITVF